MPRKLGGQVQSRSGPHVSQHQWIFILSKVLGLPVLFRLDPVRSRAAWSMGSKLPPTPSRIT